MKTMIFKNNKETFTIFVDKILYFLNVERDGEMNSIDMVYLTHGNPIVFTNDISAQLDALESEGIVVPKETKS